MIFDFSIVRKINLLETKLLEFFQLTIDINQLSCNTFNFMRFQPHYKVRNNECDNSFKKIANDNKNKMVKSNRGKAI